MFKKNLLTTTALVAATAVVNVFVPGFAAHAGSADKLQLQLGGYMEQWVGYTSQDKLGSADYSGFDQKHDAEVFFAGSALLDNGLTVGINVQLEANTEGDQIDESYMTLKSSVGEVTLGAENSVLYTMHVAPPEHGIGINSGDQAQWTSFAGVGGTTGTVRGPMGSTFVEAGRVNDANRISYYTPKIEGFQLGVSYIPNATEDSNALVDRDSAGNLTDGYAVSGMYTATMQDRLKVVASAGYSTMDNGLNNSADPSSWALGLTVSMDAITGGFSYAEAENDTGAGDMRGFNVGIGYSPDVWGVSLAYYEGERDGVGTVLAATMRSLHLSAMYEIGPGITLKGTLGHTEVQDDSRAGLDNNASYLVGGLKVSF